MFGASSTVLRVRVSISSNRSSDSILEMVRLEAILRVAVLSD
jgi:hypothetical protein